MKHMYYGLKQKEYLNKFNHEFQNMKSKLEHNSYYREIYKETVANEIERLEFGVTSSYFIRTNMRTLDNKLFIDTLNHEHVLDDGDAVELGELKGIVVKRSYDAVNDVMRYFTDIVALVEVNEDLNDEIDKYRAFLLKELKEIKAKYYGSSSGRKEEKVVEDEYEKRNREELEKAKNESRGFFSWLFGGE